MAPKKTSRAKSGKTVARAKATRKSSIRSERKAPRAKKNDDGSGSITWPA